MVGRVWCAQQEGHDVRADGEAVGGGSDRGWGFGTGGPVVTSEGHTARLWAGAPADGLTRVSSMSRGSRAGRPGGGARGGRGPSECGVFSQPAPVFSRFPLTTAAVAAGSEEGGVVKNIALRGASHSRRGRSVPSSPLCRKREMRKWAQGGLDQEGAGPRSERGLVDSQGTPRVSIQECRHRV